MECLTKFLPLFYHFCTCNLFTLLFVPYATLLLPLLPVIAPSFLFSHPLLLSHFDDLPLHAQTNTLFAR